MHARGSRGPPGIALASLCFLLYINDLPPVLQHNRYHLYADDLQIYVQFSPEEITDAIERLNADINRISNWSTADGLTPNPGKTQLILLASQRQLSNIHSASLDSVLLNGVPIPFADSVKNLGVSMDKLLSGDLWVKQTCQKTFALIHRFYR